MRLRYKYVLFIGWLLSSLALADGSAVDKVYHPYVEQLEWELEWRATHEDENPITGERRGQLHRLGLGKAVSEFVFAEIYLIGEQSSDKGFSLEAYEFEVLWQLTEQGEYALDYGLLFELEKMHHSNNWEYSTALLLEKELQRFSVTANIGVIYEWGDDFDDEWETAIALQARYRFSPRLEPALELYANQDTRGLGPVIMGVERVGKRRALRWELGAVIGLNSNSPDYTMRAMLEYEF